MRDRAKGGESCERRYRVRETLENERDALGGGIGGRVCGGKERRNGWRGVRASEPEGEAQSDSQAGRPASKARKAGQASRQAGSQAARQAGKLAGSQCTSQDH